MWPFTCHRVVFDDRHSVASETTRPSCLVYGLTEMFLYREISIKHVDCRRCLKIKLTDLSRHYTNFVLSAEGVKMSCAKSDKAREVSCPTASTVNRTLHRVEYFEGLRTWWCLIKWSSHSCDVSSDVLSSYGMASDDPSELVTWLTSVSGCAGWNQVEEIPVGGWADRGRFSAKRSLMAAWTAPHKTPSRSSRYAFSNSFTIRFAPFANARVGCVTQTPPPSMNLREKKKHTGWNKYSSTVTGSV